MADYSESNYDGDSADLDPTAGEEWKKSSAYGDPYHHGNARALKLIQLQSADDRAFAVRAKEILQETEIVIVLTLEVNFESYYRRCPECQKMFILYSAMTVGRTKGKWVISRNSQKLLGCVCGYPKTDEDGVLAE